MTKQLELPFNKENPTTNLTLQTFVKQEPKIFDSINNKNVGILYWQQKTLEEFTEKSGPLAKHNEFQIHYWALVARIQFEDASVLDIAFPTVVYNYKQEVTTAHIDFELKDVSIMSDSLLPIHNMVVNKNSLVEKITEEFKDISINIEFISVPLNTLHRHPTGVASFSGTDLRKDHIKDTGIVFPLKTADKTPSFSSIIYNNPVRLIHTEYRIATGSIEEEKGINYERCRSISFVKDSSTTVSKVEALFGVQPKDKSYTVTKDTEINTQVILVKLTNIEYNPNTDFVKEQNLSLKTYRPTTSTYSWNKKSVKPTKKTDKVSSLNYEKDIIKEIKTATKMSIIDMLQLEAMHVTHLKDHCMKLEKYYYQNESLTLEDYKELKKQDLVELAAELQQLIIEEYLGMDDTASTIYSFLDDFDYIDDDTITEDDTQYQKTALLSIGADKEAINKASDQTIDKWYKEIFE